MFTWLNWVQTFASKIVSSSLRPEFTPLYQTYYTIPDLNTTIPDYYTRTITKIDQYPRVLAYDQIIGLINISFLVNRPLMQNWKFIKMGTELKTTRNCPVLWKITSEIVELRLRVLMIHTKMFKGICGKGFDLLFPSNSEFVV